eukprot:9485673-Pyramimonas_sp.AAC.3
MFLVERRYNLRFLAGRGLALATPVAAGGRTAALAAARGGGPLAAPLAAAARAAALATANAAQLLAVTLRLDERPLLATILPLDLLVVFLIDEFFRDILIVVDSGAPTTPAHDGLAAGSDGAPLLVVENPEDVFAQRPDHVHEQLRLPAWRLLIAPETVQHLQRQMGEPWAKRARPARVRRAPRQRQA